MIDKHIEILINQLEKDNKIGKLTKDKIDRLNKQYAEDLKIYEKYLSEQNQNNSAYDDDDLFSEIFGGNYKKVKSTRLPERIRTEKGLDKNLIIISGKAGSGKTFEMLSLIKKCYEKAEKLGQKSGYYLTYNKLLTHDVSYITDKYQGKGHSKTVIKTIHQFMYERSNALVILNVMTQKRVDQLLEMQDERYDSVKHHIQIHNVHNRNSFQDLIPSFSFDKGTREYFLDFKSKYLKENTEIELLKSLENYKEKNKKSIESKIKKEVFLSDYYKVLEYILLSITNIPKLYDELGIETLTDDEWQKIIDDKYENKDKYRKEYPRTLKGFTKLVNRSLGGTRGQGKVLFLDEAQDFHPLERDIFLSLWEKKNIVICTGGKEQLIRHSEECNWKITGYDKKPIHNIIEIQKKNRTYRLKENIVKLCNFIANEFQITLDLSAIRTDNDDLGNVIIELDDPNNAKLKNITKQLEEIGIKNDLTHYESILFLEESSSNSYLDKGNEVITVNIDDNNNIQNSISKKDKKSTLPKLADLEERYVWFHNHHIESLQTIKEEDTKIAEEVPLPDTYRAIFYESCRGLEAWSVVCLDLDLFFQRKYDEEQAALYMSDDLFLSEDERRAKYAATWVLMALTRPIDTLYIHINDKNSILGKTLQKYIEYS